MMIFNHYKNKGNVSLTSITHNIGLILHVPAVMAFLTPIVSLIYREEYAVWPFLFVSLLAVLIAQLMFHTTKAAESLKVWESMIVAAISWIICPLIAAVPFYLVSLESVKLGLINQSILDLTDPLNCIFEAFSGYTGTGLSLVSAPAEFPKTLLWWRSFLQWIGGVGLVVFVLSVMQPGRQRYHLYYAESRTEHLGSTITHTAQLIWALYLLYTVGSIFLFLTAGMPLWEAINHGMCGIATGGFSVTNDSFSGYDGPIKIAAIIVMLLGAMSFVVHYEIVKRQSFAHLWQGWQHRFLFIFFIFGSLLLYLVDRSVGDKWPVIDCVFNWTSALTTTGYSTQPILYHFPVVKILLIIGMVVGGCTGSTTGGIKIQRIMHMFWGLSLRANSIRDAKAKGAVVTMSNHDGSDTPEIEKIDLNDDVSQRVFASAVLFFMWVSMLLLSWLIITYYYPHIPSFDSFFEIASAMSNGGLSTGTIVNTEIGYLKILLVTLMWLGRIEIMPAIMLFFSLYQNTIGVLFSGSHDEL